MNREKIKKSVKIFFIRTKETIIPKEINTEYNIAVGLSIGVLIFSLLILIWKNNSSLSERIEIGAFVCNDSIQVIPKVEGGNEILQRIISYSQNAREKDIKGKISVSAIIDENGNVIKTEVENWLDKDLGKIALNAVNQTKFKPALVDNKSVKTQISIPITFSKFTRFDAVLFLAKVTSMIWLVLLPLGNYWKWTFNNKLMKPIYRFLFFVLMGITILYLFIPILAIHSQWWSTYFLDNNKFFFLHTIFTLGILFLSDNLIKKHIENEDPEHSTEIETILLVIAAIKDDTSKKPVIDIQQKKLKYYQDMKKDCEYSLLRYDVTIRYADKAIFISLISTYILYLTLNYVFNILDHEMILYESFFEGALVFSLIISTAIYFLIVKKYGHKTVRQHQIGEIQQQEV